MTAVTVTRQHLAEGVPGDCTACPVALAALDAFPHATFAMVGGKYISMRDAGQCLTLAIPEDVRALIAVIDRGEHVEPFTFTIDYPAAGS